MGDERQGSIGYMVISGRRYEIPDKMKLGEARLMKQIAGVGMAEIETALEKGDPDLVAALVLIVMRRAGRRVTLEQLDDLDITEINFESDPEQSAVEGEASSVPPPVPAPTTTPPVPAQSNGASETTPPLSGAPSTDMSSI